MDEEREARIEEFRRFMMYAFIPSDVDKFCTRLLRLGFFDKPASIKHHGTKNGDLFYHSMAVTQELIHLTKALELHWERPESPYIVGMLHDLCKCDMYWNVPGEPEKWEYCDHTILTGHGDRSVIMAQQIISLTQEEIACIRWHMGAFDDKENWKYYSQCVFVYPNVLYTHTADMIASQIRKI